MLQDRIAEELDGRDPSEVTRLTLDNTTANMGSLAETGLTDAFTALRKLSLNTVELRTLSSFPALPALTHLHLSDNRISRGLNQLTRCPALAELNLSNNKIRNITELEPLKELANLRSLDLEKNPIADGDEYPNNVFDMLAGLVYLDGQDRDGQEQGSDDDDDDDDDSSSSEEEDEYDGGTRVPQPYGDEDEDDEDEDGEDGDGDELYAGNLYHDHIENELDPDDVDGNGDVEDEDEDEDEDVDVDEDVDEDEDAGVLAAEFDNGPDYKRVRLD